ncbi:MAG: protease SohB [Myxococcaceae bacterium]|nr:protease SohB [Myxococcaceae bacterium]
MEILWGTLDFAVKGFVVFLVVAASAFVVFGLSRRRRGPLPRLEVRALNRRFEHLGDALRAAVMKPKELKALVKGRTRADDAQKPKVYVLDFEGDILATQVERLREEVSAIAAVAGENDEVVVKIESPGGGVPHYGLAAAQLVRLRDRKIKVTACIDRVAASGGYLMACVADQVVAAPFAIIGSIGVVAQIPNIHKLLKKHDVDVQEMTAGEFKRTLTLVGEVTEKKKQKVQEQLEETHHLFKDFVHTHRPKLDLEKVATGEYWLGRRALELGLVDTLNTSDDYLMARTKDAQVFRVTYRSDQPWKDRLGRLAANAALEFLTPTRSLY